MRKKQKSITAHCAGRGLSLAAFCLALTLAILPVKGETVAASGQTSIQLETEETLPWSLDGEYAPSASSVTISNRRQALTVLL